jgi:sugar O-acyltransferase (sialic acid O-acetyltransferase NeuD family)
MMSQKKLILIGDGETAEMAYEYFTHDSDYVVVGFSVEKKYAKSDSLCGLPVVDFEGVESFFSPESHEAFVAISSTQLNRVRMRLYRETKEKGYRLTSYISSRAFVWHNAQIGENCFIFENNVIQHGVRIEDNVVLWSGNHIGHQTIIRRNCFITSHAVVSGFCDVGENCFLGVNCCVANNVKIGRDCVIGMGAVIPKDTESQKVYVGNPGKPIKDSFISFGVQEGT